MLSIKRQCRAGAGVGAGAEVAAFHRSKRQRTVDRPNTAPTSLDKSYYSRDEVQELLDTVERRYAQQMEAQCVYIRDLFLSIPSTNIHHMTYIS
jgi:hypothetical protein